MEGAVFVDHQTLLKFSEQQLVDCDKRDLGCNGGEKVWGMEYYKTHKEMNEAEYPYTATDGHCQYSSAGPWAYYTKEAVEVTKDDLSQMYAALALKPISVSICASSDAFHQYSTGIFNDPTCGDVHNHATNVVGYGTDE